MARHSDRVIGWREIYRIMALRLPPINQDNHGDERED